MKIITFGYLYCSHNKPFQWRAELREEDDRGNRGTDIASRSGSSNTAKEFFTVVGEINDKNNDHGTDDYEIGMKVWHSCTESGKSVYNTDYRFDFKVPVTESEIWYFYTDVLQ
ncbi:unnamed protein product [Caenorhabditis sp. 36 PRJEB53466]|nr:unnamed protein product [Caenorhabditis sp. 36 PRJEB53466]